jgi:hypothetical protein
MLRVGLLVVGSLGGCGLYLGSDHGSVDSRPSDAEPSGLLPVEPLPALQPGWSLSFARQIGSPVSDPTGVAFDGTQLWLLSGGHNSTINHLVRYDDVGLAVTRDFTLQNLIEQLGTGAYGIAWDGQFIWISVSGNTNKLVAVDPDTGAIAKTWGSPTTLGPSDLSFDATSMWIGDGTGDVYSMDLATGGIQSSFRVSAAFGRDNGIAARTGQVLVNGLFSEGLALFTDQGDLLSTAPSVLGPMCFARDQLVAVVSGQIVYNDIH